MKRILAILLVFVLCLTCFVGCGKNAKKDEGKGSTTTTQASQTKTLAEAAKYLKAVHIEDATETPIDYKLEGEVLGYPIEWSTDNEEITVTREDKWVVIDIPTGENATELTVSDAVDYKLTATISDGEGKKETVTFNRTIPAAIRGPQELIVEAAYNLAEGEEMQGTAILTGVITSIKTPYDDAQYHNITVIIQIGDLSDKRIECYRLVGEGCEDLAVGDTITVSGTLKNYNGTVEFAQECVLVNVVPGERVEAPTDPKAIMDAAFALGVGDSLPYDATLTGKISEIKTPYDSGYKNISVIIIIDGCEDKPLLCYRLKGEGAENLAVGDTITVNGYIINYNGTIEYTAGCMLKKVVPGNGGTGSTTPSGSTAPSTPATKPTGGTSVDIPSANSNVSIKDAIAIGSSMEHNTYTEGKYYVSGTVAEVTSTQYGNMKIKDDKGNTLTIYGSWSADGKAGWSEFKTQPKVGDSITIYGPIGQYNNAPQIKNGWITKLNGKAPEINAGSTQTPVDIPSANSNVSIKDAIAIGSSMEHNTYTEGKYYVSGTVAEVTSTQYGNMKIKDDKGNTLTIYGSWSADGKAGWSEFKTQPKVGDSITIYGPIGQYSNAPQIKNGWITKLNGKAPEINAGSGNVTDDYVTSPKTGVAYKLGFNQTQKGAIYYFTGAMGTGNQQYYGATTTDASQAVDIYLESSGSGYKLYFKNSSGSKQYIKLVQSGTHYNFTFGSEGSVFTWDAEKDAVYATAGDQVCYMGTYGTFNTMGTLTTEKLKDGDYIARFYVVK